MRTQLTTYLLMFGLVLGVRGMSRADDDPENKDIAFLTIDVPMGFYSAEASSLPLMCPAPSSSLSEESTLAGTSRESMTI